MTLSTFAEMAIMDTYQRGEIEMTENKRANELIEKIDGSEYKNFGKVIRECKQFLKNEGIEYAEVSDQDYQIELLRVEILDIVRGN